VIPKYSQLICAFSRKPKNMSFVHGDTRHTGASRRDFLSALGIDYKDLICAKQVYGSSVKYIREKDKGKGAFSYADAISDTDAFITDKKRLPIAIFTADCLPVFLYDPKTSAIGLVHASWRSSKERITAKAVQLMQKKFNSRTKDLYAGFGPCIRECCYEVGKEFKDFFHYGLRYRSKRYYLDLAAVNEKQLLDLGLLKKNISDAGVCTCCQNDTFFSFRKEGASCGRLMSVMMLK